MRNRCCIAVVLKLIVAEAFVRGNTVHVLCTQIHKITDDGIRFKQLYHVNSFPYVAILDPRTGNLFIKILWIK